ncbi:hypothetical protein OUZ56_007741 [Daphnia magna]|uniref:Uncharacterized protein n=1 Tax=Daphnia magna TaxID=35525 RepID=A0ABR0AAW6_9CRUS|nr:hypothetical protein OUZ56_007741 [Daphnia magna]
MEVIKLRQLHVEYHQILPGDLETEMNHQSQRLRLRLIGPVAASYKTPLPNISYHSVLGCSGYQLSSPLQEIYGVSSSSHSKHTFKKWKENAS